MIHIQDLAARGLAAPKVEQSIPAAMVADRRALHRHPEEGWCEFETTWFIVNRLRQLGLKVLLGRAVVAPDAVLGRNEELVEKAVKRTIAAGVPERFIREECDGYTGAVGILETGRPGPVTALRFDIDCLAIEETRDAAHEPNRLGYRSEYEGYSHACGHDGHTAVGLGVAAWLAFNRDALTGTVKLIFQPAEEGVRGAAAMAASGILDDVDWFAGAHIGCSARLGQVGVSHHGYLATTKFDLEFTGIPAAAGSPENGRSALMCAAATCMSLGSLPGHSEGITRVQIGKLVSGTARNIVAEHAYMQLEVRGESTKINDYMAENVKRTVAGLAAAYGCEYTLKKVGEAVTYQGDEEAVERLLAAAREVPGVDSVVDMNAKVGSEDCTILIRRVQAHGGKAAFFYFGCNHHGHHKKDFDIQDEVSLPIGWGVFTRFVKGINGR